MQLPGLKFHFLFQKGPNLVSKDKLIRFLYFARSQSDLLDQNMRNYLKVNVNVWQCK